MVSSVHVQLVQMLRGSSPIANVNVHGSTEIKIRGCGVIHENRKGNADIWALQGRGQQMRERS